MYYKKHRTKFKDKDFFGQYIFYGNLAIFNIDFFVSLNRKLIYNL